VGHCEIRREISGRTKKLRKLGEWLSEQKRLNISCADCEKACLEIKKEKPPCEQCFPGILDENIEAYKVYQFLSIDSMGISLPGIKTICEGLKIKDEAEILIKIKSIIEGINS
jgi:hypothetical protein